MRNTSNAAVRFTSLVNIFIIVVMLFSSMGYNVSPAEAAPAGTALQFTSTSNQYVTFGSASGLGVTTFTLEAWVKRDAGGTSMGTGGGGLGTAPFPQAYPVLTKGRGEGESPANLNTNYWLGIATTGVIAADFEDTAGGINHPVIGVGTIPVGQWHHIAATYDGQTWRLYLDGALDATSTLASPFTPESTSIQHAALGSALTSTGVPGTTPGYFAGTIDEARVWNVARTQADINTDKNSELTSGTGLIGRWGMNEGSGPTIADSTAPAVNGTLTNGPTWVSGFPIPDAIPPAAPTGLAASALGQSVNLTWTANSEPDLAGYNVYRSISPSVPLTGPINGATLVTGASYGDGGRSYGTQYYYVVTAVDTSTNQSTASNEVFATPLASNGSGLQFDGTNDYVTFGPTTALGSQNFTVETWFKRTATGISISTGTNGVTLIPLVAKGAPQGENSNVDENYVLGIRASDNVLAGDFEIFAACNARPAGDNNPIAGVTPIVNNTWYHAAFTYDGAALKLYLNGNLESTLASTCIPRHDNIQPAALGTTITTAPLAQGFFAGVIDEARIWSVARTQAQILADINNELTSGTNLIARWGLNEGSGTTANSSVGSFPGTLTNGPLWVAGFVPPPPGNLAPNAPTVNAPLNGATGTGTSPTLDVGVSDPESSPLTVTFFGRPNASGVFAQIAQNTGVASGSSTTAPWASLDPGQQYEWFVTVSDGSATTTGPTWNFRTAPGSDPVFVGAGDIADCTRPQDTTTAAIIQGVDGTVWTTGDNVYPTGTAANFTNCYHPTWGTFLSRTRPVAGNHDYGTGVFNNLTDYHAYFGANATDAGGKSYYSYDIAGSNWHIVNLDSECALVAGGCTDGSPQENWLQADLAANMSKNVIGLFHKPRYSSSSTNLVDLQPFVDDLYAAGADLILVGHDHVYERFAPIDADGALDATYGIRHFTVGTGGASLFTSFGTTRTGSELRHLSTYGIMKLTLHASSYDWKFMPVAGSTFTDSGTQAVHAAPPVASQPTIPISDTTGEKPQSKVWKHAGTWWTVLPSTSVAPAGTWLWRLEPDDTWTNVLHLSNSTDTQADAKVVGNVTHVLLHGASPALVSIQYVAVGNTYEPWTSRPAAALVSLPGSETATIDIDSLGRMWLATENGANLNVYYSDTPYSTFTGPITLASNISADDIGVVTALPNNTIGVLWSNQTTERFGFRVHVDGANPVTWSADEVPASQSALNVGFGMADDHLNVAVASDGTLYAAVKTSYDTAGFPKVALLIRRPNGTWDNLYEVDQSGTRGIVLLNEQDDTVRVVYTSSEGFNDILAKQSATSAINFSPAMTLMTGGLNDATSQKANWTDEVLVLASSATEARGVFLTESQVGWWQMENNAQDSSSYANHGSLIGSPAFVTGRVGQAILLNGTTQYISVPDANSLDLTTALTIAAWIRPSSATPGTQDIVSKQRASGTLVDGYGLSLSSAGTVFIRFNHASSPDVYRINSTTNYPLNNSAWMHVAATYDGTTMRLYINGVQEGGNLTGPTAIAANNLALGIGAQSNNDRRFAGLLDDVRIEARALSPAEIAALAAAGANNAPNAPTVNAPANGATGIGTSPTLDVGVSDPNSDPLTVTFFGRPYVSGNFVQIAQNTGVASGSNTTAPWANLGAGQRFEWYVTVSDGIATTIGPTWTFNTTPSADPVFVGSGDIASCAAAVIEDIATGELISGIQGTIFTTGDNVYPNGTAAEFANCYETTPWGSPSVQSRTRPVPGNHDWGTGVTNSLAGYFGYYGANATDAGGKSYYSYDIAGSNWHVVNLDSECQLVPGAVTADEGCGVGSAQEVWLKADLAANMSKNVIAVWHKPRYSSGSTDYQALQPLWDALYNAGVDILLDGHDHIYERTAPMKSGATLADPPVADPLYGIRQFTIGTGGEAHHGLGTLLPTSESSNDETFGIFKLTLHATTYDWVFLPIAGSTFTDSGTGSVHAAPPVCYALTLSHTGQGSNPVASPANSAGCSSGQYLSGASISLSGAAPNSGWQISSWTGTNANSSTANTNTVNMPASNHTASVNYTAIPPTCYALTLSHTGLGSNPVASPANSAGCSSGQYLSGASISLSGAVPNSGWQISSWTGTNANSSTANTNTVTMPTSAHTASVNYTAICYALTLSHTGLGSNPVASPANSTGCAANQYVSGASISLSGAVPNTGWQISSWTGTNANSSTASTNTVTMPASAHTASVNYTQSTYTLNVTAVGSGTVAKNPNQASYLSGTSVQLTASPASGWTFTGWSGNASGTANPISILMDGNKSVTANFTSVGASIIFADGFESGNLAAWTSSTIDAGDLSVTPTAALVGSQGLQALLDDNKSIFVTDDSPNAEMNYLASFRFDPNSIAMASGDTHFIFNGFTGTSTAVMRLEFQRSSTNYQVRARLLNDASAWTNTNWFIISDAPHSIELDWHAATGVGANNGSLRLSIDGVQQVNLTGVDNDTRRIDRARLGAVAGVDTGTRGTYYFDEFGSQRQGGGPPPTATLTVNKTGTGNGTVTSNPAGINCGSTCSSSFNTNTVVTLTATAASGSTFTGWSGAGCSGTGTCIVTMTTSTSVTANFNLQSSSPTLTVSKTGTGSGTVTSNPAGINCGPTCSSTFNANTVVTLTATAASGSTFTGWSGAGCSGTSTCIVTMTASTSVTANFNLTSTTDVIFADGFESGSLSAWSASTIDAGDLSVSPAAALVGSQGLQALLDDNKSIYVTDNNPNAEPRYRARFYFDPNSIAMASGDAHIIVSGLMGTSTAVLRLEFQRSSTNYQVRVRVLNDASAWTNTNWFTLSDAPHSIELDWRAATSAGANNGGLTLWIDNAQQVDLTGMDNDTRRIDAVRFGSVTGVDTGTRGTYYFDAFDSRRQTYIGP